MEELLFVLACQFSFLYRELSFRIIGSHNYPEQFGNADLQLTNDHIEIVLILERGEFSVMLRPAGTECEWFSLGVVADVLRDRAINSSYRNLAALLLRIYPKLIESFSPKQWASTRKKLLSKKGMPL